MSEPAQDREIGALARLAFALVALAATAALAACGSDLGSESEDDGETQVAEAGPAEGEFTMSTGPLYIDKGKGGVDGPGGTLAEFEAETGITPNYLEDINANESFFAKLRPELENGESGGRDIIVATDWMAKRYYDLGYAQELDKSALPNVEENLLPSLRNPDFDPERSFTVPWQSGLTGIVVRSDLAPDIDSVDDLFDPKYKGKVTLLEELRDTVPLVMMAEGIDPHEATKEQWLETIDKIKQAVESGQIRDITGNDYIDDLPRGDIVAAIGWSGDAEYLKLDNPEIEFVMPADGCVIWSDDIDHPGRRAQPGRRLCVHGLRLRARERGPDRRLRLLHDPGRRRARSVRAPGREGAREQRADLPERGVHRGVRDPAHAPTPADEQEIEEAWGELVAG